MTWYFYQQADESTQIFIGVVLIAAIVFVLAANLFFWIQERIKKRK